MPSRYWILLVAVFLQGCESTGGLTSSAPTPARVVLDRGLLPMDSPVRWGGRIVALTNRAQTTLLEILAFPLDGAGQPRLTSSSIGRFYCEQSGYLEANEYRTGRSLTVSGRLKGYTQGSVGGAKIQYPIVTARQIDLWPDSTQWYKPRVNLGIGAGSHGGGVSIGIGF